MSRIKVLQLIEDVGAPGGAEKVVFDLASGLDRNQFDSLVAVVEHGALEDYYRSAGIELEVIPRGGRIATVVAIRNLIHTHKIDILHSHLMKMNTYNGLSRFVSNSRRVCSVHGLLPHETTSASRRYGRFASLMTDRTVVVSSSLARSVITTYRVNPAKIVTIPNGFDPDRIGRPATPEKVLCFRQKHKLAEGTPTIIAIGNVRDVKGYDHLINASALVKKDIPNLRVFVAGYDRLVESLGLAALKQNLGLTDTVTFLGHFDDIATLFSIAELYVCSSVHEGFSITTIEAMAWGLPVVVTDCGGPTEIVDHGNAGTLVASGDPASLAAGIKFVLTDKPRATELALKGQKRAREEFTIRRFLERHEQLYRELVS